VNITGTLFGELMPEAGARSSLPDVILFLHGELATTLTAFRNTIQQYLRVIDMLNRGFASPDILPVKELSKILIHVKEQMPQDMQLVYGNGNESLYPYYHNRLASIMPGKNDIRGIIQIPIASPDNRFQIYKALPFPTSTNNETNKQRFRWAGADTYVAMSMDRSRFTELGPWFSPKTCLNGPPMVCPAQTVIATDPSTQCLFQILTGDIHHTKGHCPLETVNEKVTVVKPINETEWVISTTEMLNVKPSCLDIHNPALPLMSMHGFAVTGELIISVPRHCTALVGNYMIPLRLQVMTRNTVTKTALMDMDLDIQQLLDLKGQALEEDHLHDRFLVALQDLSALNGSLAGYDHTSEDIYRIISKMTNLHEEFDKLKPVWLTHYMSLGGWAFTILIVLVALYLVIKCRRRILSWTLDMSTIIPVDPRPGPAARAAFHVQAEPMIQLNPHQIEADY